MRVGVTRAAVLVTALAILLGCARTNVNREEWQRMTREDRVLYVKTLVAAEKVKDAKGGNGRDVTRPVEEYVIEIDRGYARGDAREAQQIFAELSPGVQSTQ